MSVSWPRQEAQAIQDGLVERARRGTITLLYATRDGAISNAAVLQQVLTQRLAGQAREE